MDAMEAARGVVAGAPAPEPTGAPVAAQSPSRGAGTSVDIDAATPSRTSSGGSPALFRAAGPAYVRARSGGLPITREALMEQGVSAAQADAMVFRAHEEEVLREHFDRLIWITFAATLVIIPTCFFLFVWLVIEFHANKDTACASPLRLYAVGAMVIVGTKAFNSLITRCCCCWAPDPESLVPEQPPKRVRSYRVTLDMLCFAWHISGVVWVYTDSPDAEGGLPSCGEAAPGFLQSAQVYASFGIACAAVQAFGVVGLRRVFQVFYRNGLVRSKSAAPQGTLEMSTTRVAAAALEAHMQENPSCPVCMDDYRSGADDVLKVKFCGHIFHEECLKSWMKVNRTCPLCRLDLVSGHCEDASRRIGAAQQADVGALDGPAGDVVI